MLVTMLSEVAIVIVVSFFSLCVLAQLDRRKTVQCPLEWKYEVDLDEPKEFWTPEMLNVTYAAGAVIVGILLSNAMFM